MGFLHLNKQNRADLVWSCCKYGFHSNAASNHTFCPISLLSLQGWTSTHQWASLMLIWKQRFCLLSTGNILSTDPFHRSFHSSSTHLFLPSRTKLEFASCLSDWEVGRRGAAVKDVAPTDPSRISSCFFISLLRNVTSKMNRTNCFSGVETFSAFLSKPVATPSLAPCVRPWSPVKVRGNAPPLRL